MPLATPVSPAVRNRPRLRRAPRPRPRPETQIARHRSAGGPEDRALYECPCGHAFRADVTAAVSCPRCGAGQPW